MYSLVLMTALTAGAEAPACHHCYSSCHGCYSSCYGCCGYSCYSSCYGCCGYGCYSSCHGCCGYSYYSSCYGCYSSCYGCSGCYGTGCYGCYGTYSPYFITAPAGTPVESAPAPKPAAGSKARLILEVPAEAKLYIDDQLMKSASARRTFSTPALEAGVSYYYMLRAEVSYNGKTYTETKRVIVRRGEEVKTSFGELEESLAAAKSAIQVGAR